MNDDYKTSLTTHDAQLDLSWWDQNYGNKENLSCILFIFR